MSSNAHDARVFCRNGFTWACTREFIPGSEAKAVFLKSPIRLIVAIPNALFRRGVISFLREHSDLKVISEARDGTDLLVKAKKMQPDLVVMELSMSGLNALEVMRSIKETLPNTRIVILTGSQEHLVDAINHGAQGYLSNKIDPNVLVETLKGICRGEIHINGHADQFRLSSPAPRPNSIRRREDKDSLDSSQFVRYSLSPRQRDVLQHLSEGVTNKEIALSLGISENTVKNHVKCIFAKLQVRNRIQALAIALYAGIVEAPMNRQGP
jgi:two-component system, NarL family, nitrate/nitrite response regulator NarL